MTCAISCFYSIYCQLSSQSVAVSLASPAICNSFKTEPVTTRTGLF
jgi:hypothetical protein